MLKETIICIVIVIAIFFGDNITQAYTKDSIGELSSELMSLREKLTQDDIENEQIKSEVEGIYNKWAEKYNKLAYYIEHDELESVETELVSMRSYIETGEYQESISQLDKSVFILRHIEEKYEFNLTNVF